MRAGAVKRALRLIEAHPTFAGWAKEGPQHADGGVTIGFACKVDLPPAWMERGTSPSGVRPVEPISVRFPDDFPARPPIFYLRADFPRNFPHLQPGSASDPPRPCLVQGSESNLYYGRGISGMLDQLAAWLHKAARDVLNDDPNVWEPVRRDIVDDNVLLDLDHIRSIVSGRNTLSYLQATYASFQLNGAILHQILVSDTPSSLKPATWGKRWQKQVSGLGAVGETFALVLHPPNLPNGKAYICAAYQPETVTDVQSLRERVESYGCRTDLDSFLGVIDGHAKQLDAKKFRRPTPVAVLVCVPRPRPVVGTTAILEILAYVLEVHAHKGLPVTATTPVRVAAVVERLSVDLLQRFNQEEPSLQTRGWAAVGCGSLGSKIAVHMGRSGRSPSLLIDSAFMKPHNFARHGSLPPSDEKLQLLPVGKVHALQATLEAMRQTPETWPIDVPAMLGSPERVRRAGELAGWLLVNTTASVRVREALAGYQGGTSLPRIADAALYARGQVGVFAVEGPERNPDVGDLICAALGALGNDPEAADAVFSPEAQLELIRTGMGCGSETMKVTDATISMHAAAMSTELARLHHDGLPAEGGFALVGKLSGDGLGLSWRRHNVPPVQRLSVDNCGASPWTVHIFELAHRKIVEDVALYPKVETGGVLFGRVSEAAQVIYVTDVLEAPPDSKRTATLFELGTEGLTQKIDEAMRPTRGALFCVGTWHSHLVPSGPSGKDRETAVTIAASRYSPSVLPIHTP
ncbi:MAG: hypothetical protein OSA97_12665, partial [Nevskia sp.]|nr:hypothetical protein [Nevskia sp.]